MISRCWGSVSKYEDTQVVHIEHDVFAVRDLFMRQKILLCFNGPFSSGLIEELGNALKNYLKDLETSSSVMFDVFSAYIEMTQNIRLYNLNKGYNEQLACSTVIISRDDVGRYVLSAGNVVSPNDGSALVERIAHLASLDKAQLRALYKDVLRKPRVPGASSGAGLGLIDVARRASEPLRCSLQTFGEGLVFFSLRVVI